MTKKITFLKPIANVTKAEKVVDQIMDFLEHSGIQPGDAIPKEMEMAEQLGVSRAIVREALSHLKMMSIIESRKKRGMVLAQVDMFPALEKVLVPKLLLEETRQDIFELRLMLEVGIADLLFARIQAADIIVLEDLIKKEEVLMAKKRTPSIIRKLVDLDASFHGKLYSITQNRILQSLQNLILPTIRHVIKHQFDMDPLSYGKVTHKQLVNILKKGTPEKFRKAMINHLELHFEKLIGIKK